MSPDRTKTSGQEADTQASLFTPFQWVGNQDSSLSYNLLSDVRDLAAGVTVALQMIERSDMFTDNGQAPLFDRDTEFRLTRMSIAAMRCIEERIDAHFDKQQVQE